MVFNYWSSFGDHTFFVAPDENSQEYLNNLIINLHKYLGFKSNNINAHLTIARGLDSKKMKSSYILFNNVEINLEFNCDAIYLKKFNNIIKQYSDIIEKISFIK